MSAVIEIEKLTKIYESAARGQDVHALKELDLTIDEGEIVGYLGPNGSGKTTTIKMLLGLIFPTSGSIRIFGKSDVDSPDVKRNIGYLPEGAYYPDFLKGEEVLRFYGRLYGMGGKELERRMDEVLELVGMTHARKRLIRGYSKGMRQRIGLGQALISDPKLMILDEPTTGLDPVARKEIRDLIVEMRTRGKTVMISSHELLEVELISDRVGCDATFGMLLGAIAISSSKPTARTTKLSPNSKRTASRPRIVSMDGCGYGFRPAVTSMKPSNYAKQTPCPY